jgi:signal transduction histidine kinase
MADDAIAELAGATEELRELARGIHPPVLTEYRLSPAVEIAAYYVVSESLTSMARHGRRRDARGADRRQRRRRRRSGERVRAARSDRCA